MNEIGIESDGTALVWPHVCLCACLPACARARGTTVEYYICVTKPTIPVLAGLDEWVLPALILRLGGG